MSRLGRDDLPLDPGELVALGRDLERQHVAAERGAADGRDPADGFETPRSCGHPFLLVHGDAEVRRATRSVAERARGLALISASPARTGLATARSWGPGRFPLGSGRWREPAGTSPLRSRRKRFTSRSSRLWKVTTASRPPGRSTCSAASSPPSSSSSSSFKWMRIAWKVRVAGSFFMPAC